MPPSNTNKSFNSILVWLKACNLCHKFHLPSMFQFHSGLIKRGLGGWYSFYSYWSFNSILVWLKALTGRRRGSHRSRFNSILVWLKANSRSQPQTSNKSFNSILVWLKGASQALSYLLIIGFNSILVWLKAALLYADALSENVSIPFWSD